MTSTDALPALETVTLERDEHVLLIGLNRPHKRNAFNQAMAFVRKDKSREVPVHLRNAPTKLMKELGYGHEYRYAHDEPDAYAAGETYLPDDMREPGWYAPVPRGLEIKIGDKLTWLRELDKKARGK